MCHGGCGRCIVTAHLDRMDNYLLLWQPFMFFCCVLVDVSGWRRCLLFVFLSVLLLKVPNGVKFKKEKRKMSLCVHTTACPATTLTHPHTQHRWSIHYEAQLHGQNAYAEHPKHPNAVCRACLLTRQEAPYQISPCAHMEWQLGEC